MLRPQVAETLVSTPNRETSLSFPHLHLSPHFLHPKHASENEETNMHSSNEKGMSGHEKEVLGLRLAARSLKWDQRHCLSLIDGFCSGEQYFLHLFILCLKKKKAKQQNSSNNKKGLYERNTSLQNAFVSPTGITSRP